MKIKLFQVDTFTDTLFKGNPAAVCPLYEVAELDEGEWPNDAVLQNIAAENNLAETAFFIKSKQGYDIRWFTPTMEVDLCGHATLASAFVLFTIFKIKSDKIIFNSRSGLLIVTRENNLLTLDFPAQPATNCEPPAFLKSAFAQIPTECLQAEDYLLVFETEQDIINAKPKIEQLMQNDKRGVIITAPANEVDFVCRFFAPNCGIDEDPVTGSAYTQLMPYWAKRLNRSSLRAKQLSQRGGEISLKVQGERILISGNAVLFMTGEIHIQ